MIHEEVSHPIWQHHNFISSSSNYFTGTRSIKPVIKDAKIHQTLSKLSSDYNCNQTLKLLDQELFVLSVWKKLRWDG